MPNSRATRSPDSLDRLATATSSTPGSFWKPGICRLRVFLPAPTNPTRIVPSVTGSDGSISCVLRGEGPHAHSSHSTVDGRGVPGQPAWRARDLGLRRTGQGRDDTPGLPQSRTHAGSTLRRAPRAGHAHRADVRDRYRLGRLYAQVLPRPEERRRTGRRACRDRRLGAPDLWVDG